MSEDRKQLLTKAVRAAQELDDCLAKLGFGSRHDDVVDLRFLLEEQLEKLSGK